MLSAGNASQHPSQPGLFFLRAAFRIDRCQPLPHTSRVKDTAVEQQVAPAARAPDGNEEYRDKVKVLMAKYGYHVKTLFEHYDKDVDGAINIDELVTLLRDAGFGNGLTRRMIANIGMKKADKNGDDKLQFDELGEHILKGDTNKDGYLSADEIDAAGR